MRRALPATLAVAILALGGCGSDDPPATPLVCTGGAGAYLEALRSAPAEALLDGETPISGCVVPEQATGDVNDVGATVIEAATRLNTEANEDPGGAAAVRLGFLVGSIEEGASGTAGIHTDLVRRLNAAARFSEDGEPLPAQFERAYGEGYAAARGQD